MANSFKSAAFLMESRLAAAAAYRDADALYDLGVAYSTGSNGVEIDLVEAHKWLNIAASWGSIAAQECRAEVADEMTAREVADAQKQARAWLAQTLRRAA